MYITTEDFNKLNEIALTLVRNVDTKTYETMCDIFARAYEHEKAQVEDMAKDTRIPDVEF